MNNSQALILGIVQGLTEYLPISSSAHLVLVPHIFGWNFEPSEAFVFDTLVQLGTLLGVLYYFFTPIQQVIFSVVHGLALKKPFHNEDARLGWLVVLASIPAAFFGFTFKEDLAHYFSSPRASSYCLIITGLFLCGAERINTLLTKSTPTKKDALLIGFAQSLALFPGISRSGSTIAAAMACGLNRSNAARFSFLMSIPVMIGASFIAFYDLLHNEQLIKHLVVPLALGFMSAALTGYMVIRWFMNYIGRRRLDIFALYCLIVGLWGVFYFG
jgi:undecaprenyl-diphosphatase